MLGKLEIKHHRARHGYVLLSGQNFLKDCTRKISKYLKHGLAYVLLPCRWTNASCNMIGQWYLKGQSYDAIHNRYVITITTQERLLKRTLHRWSSSFNITQTGTRKRSILIKTGTKFCTKGNAHLWRRCTAIYAPFFQIMRLWRRARGYPKPWTEKSLNGWINMALLSKKTAKTPSHSVLLLYFQTSKCADSNLARSAAIFICKWLSDNSYWYRSRNFIGHSVTWP